MENRDVEESINFANKCAAQVVVKKGVVVVWVHSHVQDVALAVEELNKQ
jgi:hypothetical protein